MADVLIIYRDWRKRLIHKVELLETGRYCFRLKVDGEVCDIIIPKDCVNYIGPPKPWEEGGSFGG